jgi:hypothetical protein
MQTSAPFSGSFASVASSADGTKLIAAGSYGLIYLSPDSGATWIPQTNAPFAYWQSVASSADGTMLFGVTYWPQYSAPGIYASWDSGGTWTQTSAPYIYWLSIASSADGIKLAAIGFSDGNVTPNAGSFIYTSPDSGGTWIQTSAPTNLGWNAIASSSDGTKLVAVGSPDGYLGYIYTSTNSGAAWTWQTNAPNAGAVWASVASSADGTRIVAGDNVPDVGIRSLIYTSTDAGMTWVLNCVPNGFLRTRMPSVASSADGSKLVADGEGDMDSGIFTWQAAALQPQITRLAIQSNDVLVAWSTYQGSSNIVQAASGDLLGDYSTNCFVDLSPPVIAPGNNSAVAVSTNYLDVGGATNGPSRFYRVQVTPPTTTVYSNQPVASDSAADVAYSGGWTNGCNGGRGFSPWTLIDTSTNVNNNGFFIGSSTNNAFGTSPGIDTNGKSWGIYANSGNTGAAFRVFSVGSMNVGQALLINFDNGYVDSNMTVGVALRTGTPSSSTSDATNGARFVFQYTGFDPEGLYRIVDEGGVENTGVPYTGTGLRLKFILTGTDTYTLQTIDNASGKVYFFSGTLGGTVGGTLDSIALFSNDAGNGPQFDTFFNSLQIIGP